MNREAKTILLRSEHSKNKDPRLIPLVGELDAIIERRWQARAIPKPDGTTGLAEFVFHKDGAPVGDFRKGLGCGLQGSDRMIFSALTDGFCAA